MPSSITYSNVTVRRGAIFALSRQASINSFNGYFLLIGTSSFLNSSVTACNDTARLTSQTWLNLYIAGTTPEVLTVTRRLDKPKVKSSIIRFMAATVLSKLSKGSPMPIMTTLVILFSKPKRFCATITWPIISAVVKLRLKPCWAVEQKVHAKAQPICDETHKVPRPSSGMNTVSIRLPQLVCTTHLRVPSLAICSNTISGVSITQCSAR